MQRKLQRRRPSQMADKERASGEGKPRKGRVTSPLPPLGRAHTFASQRAHPPRALSARAPSTMGSLPCCRRSWSCFSQWRKASERPEDPSLVSFVERASEGSILTALEKASRSTDIQPHSLPRLPPAVMKRGRHGGWSGTRRRRARVSCTHLRCGGAPLRARSAVTATTED